MKVMAIFIPVTL